MIHMPTYRLQRLDEAGKVGPASQEMDASDDYDAMDKARAAGHAFASEVWLGRRLIGRVVASGY
jgi:hypothetical protein